MYGLDWAIYLHDERPFLLRENGAPVTFCVSLSISPSVSVKLVSWSCSNSFFKVTQSIYAYVTILTLPYFTRNNMPWTVKLFVYGVMGLGIVLQDLGVLLGFGFQGSGFRVQGSRFRVQGLGFRVYGSGFRVQSSGFMVQGLECRIWSLGFRI